MTEDQKLLQKLTLQLSDLEDKELQKTPEYEAISDEWQALAAELI